MQTDHVLAISASAHEKNDFIEIFKIILKNLIRYRSENNFVQHQDNYVKRLMTKLQKVLTF